MPRKAGSPRQKGIDLSERETAQLATVAELANMTEATFLLSAVRDRMRMDLNAAGAWSDEDEAVYQDEQPRVSPRSTDGKLRFYRKKS